MSSYSVKRKRSEVVNDSEDGRSEASAASGIEATGLLNTLQGHIDDLRSLVHCGVCVRLLYEPFTLPCGHTFCYGCLTEWFPSQDNNRKTCPDCRAVVKAEPAPAYLIRNFVQIFIGRAELLEGGETTDQHLENQRVESAKVESDKNNNNIATGGLFRGCFKRAEVAPIIDAGDGVDRCPLCFWELEEDECNRCGYIDRNWESDTRLAEEEEEDEEDEVPVVINRRRDLTDISNSGDSSGESDDEEDGSSDMASFIDDDDDRSIRADFSDMSTSTMQDGSRGRSRSESFGGIDFWRGSSPFGQLDFMDNRHDYDNNHDYDRDEEDGDEDDEDESPIAPVIRRVQRRFGHGQSSLNTMVDIARNTHTGPFRPHYMRRLPGSHSRNPISLDSDSPHQPSRHRHILQDRGGNGHSRRMTVVRR